MQKQTQKQQDYVEQALKEFEGLSADRNNFESHWLEIADRVMPNDRNMFQSKGRNSSTKGEKRTQLQFDSSAQVALSRFASILDSLLTPRNQTWHKLKASNEDINKDREVRLWFEQVNRILFRTRYAPRANFSAQNQQNYLSLGAYGSGTVFIDRLRDEPGIRYRNIHLSEIYFAENHQGLVDKAVRYFSLTARQAYQKWGDKVASSVKNSLKTNPEKESYYLHVVKPRTEDYDPNRLDYRGKKIESCYISFDEKILLEESGYTSFPFAISRYVQASREVYGRSPAMDVLPAIKTLNEQKKTMLKQGHRVVDPVLLAVDDGVLSSFNLKPGAVNYGGVSPDGRPLVHALPTGNLMISKEMMDEEKNAINDAFLTSLFQILTDSPQMTATEVLERTKEKGMLIAPTIGRQQSEYLGPLIDRELELLVQQNLIPPMPPLLREAEGEYQVQYESPLSRAQRAEEASGFQRTLESVIGVVNVTGNPAPLDYFDFDTIVPEIAAIQGVPESWLKAKDLVDKERAQRAQQAQQQQMVQAAPGAAAMIKATAVAQGKK